MTTKDDYKAVHAGSNFNRLDTLFEAYDPAIPSNATMTDRMRAEREGTAKLLCQRLLQSAERGACTLILGAIEDTWLSRLKNATT